MLIFEWFIVIFAWLFFFAGIFIVISCIIGYLRFKDFFVKMFAVKISSIYGISFILFALGLMSGEFLSFIQIFLIIILNILITLTTVHIISRMALSQNIANAGISRRKYNEIQAQKEKDDAEKSINEMMENKKL